MNEINFNVEDIEQVDLSIGMGIKEIYPPIENLEVMPTKEQQVFNHENSYGYDNVTVNAIPDEYIIPDGTLEITENTTYDVTPYSRVSASVHPIPNLQDKELTINENGTHNIKADEGYDGLNQVSVTVDAIEDLTEELNTYNEEITEQETIINDIVETLKTKAIGGGEDDMDIYSTEEIVVGTWIDGKPIYRKVIVIDVIGKDVNENISYNIANVDKIWLKESASFIASTFETLPVNWYYTPEDYMRTGLNKGIGTIKYKTPSDLSTFSGFITLEYTKTTD